MAETREVIVDIGGRSFKIVSDDNYLNHIGNVFEPDMVKLFRTLATESETILDVGANIGCTAILLGGLAKKVFAFEPSPTTFDFLERNISAAKMRNIHTQNIGLGVEAGEFQLTFSPSSRSGGFVSNQLQASEGHNIEKIVIHTMDEFVKAMKIVAIDFIKIDVEGFEGHVLRGGAETVLANKPTAVIELNHWCLNAFQRTSIPDFLDFLRSMFPILLAIDGESYLNLYDKNEAYLVMYHHIIHNRFMNVVGAFDENRLVTFRAAFQHSFSG